MNSSMNSEICPLEMCAAKKKKKKKKKHKRKTQQTPDPNRYLDLCQLL